MYNIGYNNLVSIFGYLKSLMKLLLTKPIFPGSKTHILLLKLLLFIIFNQNHPKSLI